MLSNCFLPNNIVHWDMFIVFKMCDISYVQINFIFHLFSGWLRSHFISVQFKHYVAILFIFYISMAPIYYLLLVQRLYRIRKAFKDFQFILKRKFSYLFLKLSRAFVNFNFMVDQIFKGFMKIFFPALCVFRFLSSNLKF